MAHLVLEIQISWSLFWDQRKMVMTLEKYRFPSNNQHLISLTLLQTFKSKLVYYHFS